MGNVFVYQVDFGGYRYIVTVTDGDIASVTYMNDAKIVSVLSAKSGHLQVGCPFPNEKMRLPAKAEVVLLSSNYSPFSPY